MLKRIAILHITGLITFFMVHLVPHAIAEEAASERTIDRLIDDLGSSQFEIREAASRTLMDLEDAIPALSKARNSADLEVRRRAVECLRALARKRARRGLARAKLLGKAGRIVEAADRIAHWGVLDRDGEGWNILTQFAEKVNVSTARYFPSVGFWNYRKCPKGDFHRYAGNTHPREIAAPMIDIDSGGSELIPKDRGRDARNIITYSNGILLLRGGDISLKSKALESFGLLGMGIVAAKGNVQVEESLLSLIIAGGNVKVNCLEDSILVCDGDVVLNYPGGDYIIIARGKVTCIQEKNRISAVHSGSGKYLVRSGNCLELPGGKTIDLGDGTPDPLAFVKFFELADVGIQAEDLPRPEKSAGVGVRLTEVSKDSPLAAGLRCGDVITAIEEKKTPTTEFFRRLLRRKLAKGGPTITFTLRRSGKTMDVPIPVKE